MAEHIRRELPAPEAIRAQYPVTLEHRVHERQDAVKDIIAGTDKRLLFVIGPCSASPFDAVREYGERLARLQEKVCEKILIVMRMVINKPRTKLGWKGPLISPNPLAEENIAEGIQCCRAMMHDVGKQLPMGDEMLSTNNEDYFQDLLSYTWIGARTSLSPPHREFASGLDTAVGVKNPRSGDIEEGVEGIVTVQAPHVYPRGRHEIGSDGNPYAHLILRGSKRGPNYDHHSISQADHLLREARVSNPAILVDASHDNCLNGHGRDPTLQKSVIRSVLQNMLDQRREYALVRGFLVESFLKRGSQKISPEMDLGGLSNTDPCIGWDDTENLFREVVDMIDRIPQHASTS